MNRTTKSLKVDDDSEFTILTDVDDDGTEIHRYEIDGHTSADSYKTFATAKHFAQQRNQITVPGGALVPVEGFKSAP